MALIWADGFDHHGNAASALQDGYIEWNGNIGLDTSAPRTGSTCIRFSTLNAQQRITIAHASPQATMGQGYGIRLNTVNANITSSFLDAAGGVQCLLGFNADGSISAYRGNGASLLGTTAPNVLSFGSYKWVEWKATIDPVNGYIEVRVQGDPVLIITNANTQGTANTTIGRTRLGSNNGGSTDGSKDMRFDDWVIWDTTGPDNNDFIGIRKCFTSLMTGDSLLQQWVPSVAGSGFAMIDEVPPNTTDYVEGVNVGDISEFTKDAISILTTSIAGIRLASYAANSDAGSAKYRHGINSNGFVLNSAEITPGTAYGYTSTIFERDPNGNIPWTKAAFDAAIIRLTRST